MVSLQDIKLRMKTETGHNVLDEIVGKLFSPGVPHFPPDSNITLNRVIWACFRTLQVFLLNQNTRGKNNMRFLSGPLNLEFLNIYFPPAAV